MTLPSLLSNFVEPCTICGLPCAGTYKFWCGARGLEVDQPRIDAAFCSIIDTAEDYDLLPKFVREYHEGREGFASDTAVELDPVDLAATLELFESNPHTSELGPIAAELVAELRDLVRQAARGSDPLMFLDN